MKDPEEPKAQVRAPLPLYTYWDLCLPTELVACPQLVCVRIMGGGGYGCWARVDAVRKALAGNSDRI